MKVKGPCPWMMGPGLGRKGTVADVVEALHPFSPLLCPAAAAVDSSGVCSPLSSTGGFSWPPQGSLEVAGPYLSQRANSNQ